MAGAEAAGELVTGALVAGAVEREHAPARPHDGLCLNCGTGLLGSFCHRCGQPGHVHRSLGALWHDIAHGVLHFEGKIWNTLPLLAFRPGELTRRYIHGERARFVSPMGLFLFSVFLMFATFSAIGASIYVPDNQLPTKAARAAIEAELPKARAKLATTRAAERSATSEADKKRLRRAADSLQDDVANMEAMVSSDVDKVIDLPATGWKRLDKGIAKANENPNLTFYKVQSNAYKLSWALIPFSVPFLWLLNAWHRRFAVYDHAVFVTYSLSFMSMLTIALTLASEARMPPGLIGTAALVIPPTHMYRQLRGAYGTRRRWALLRTALLVAFATFILIVFVILLLAQGVLG